MDTGINIGIDIDINKDTNTDKYTNVDIDIDIAIDMDEDIETVIVYLSQTVHIVMVMVHSIDSPSKVYRNCWDEEKSRVRDLKHLEHHEDFNKVYTAQQFVEIHGGRSESVDSRA